MYIERRRRKYFAFHTIPADVRHAFGGKVRLTAKLDTSDDKVARTRARLLEVKWRRLIEQARSQSTDAVERDAAFWRQLLADAPEHEKALVRDAIADEARERIERAGARLGIVDERDQRYAELPEHADATRFHAIATGALVRVDERLDEYLASITGRVEAKSLDMQRSTIKKFAKEFHYISDVERKSVQQWINRLVQDHGKKPATIGRALSELRSFWRYLKSVEVVDDDSGNTPFHHLSLPANGSKRTKQDERKPFTPADMRRLHTAAVERGDGSLADLIELAMWTGARIEELAALRVSRASGDVLTIEDVKTAAGWREVPVHSKLKATVERLVRESKDGFLLSGLTANKYGKRKGAIGKRFSHLKSELGFGKDRVLQSHQVNRGNTAGERGRV